MALQKTLFPQFLATFAALVTKFTELINGKKFEEPFLYREMLDSEFSADLTWGSTTLKSSIVAADVVSMNSRLPLKNGDTIVRATGILPKIGLKYKKDEKDISDINVMIARGAVNAEVGKKLLSDVNKAMKGIMVRNEILFLQGLSTGEIYVDDDTNTGTGVRASFGYLAKNKFRSLAPWGTEGAKPVSDMREVFDKAEADGKSIGLIMMSKSYFNKLKASDEGKALNANYYNLNFSSAANLAVPTTNNFLEALKDEFGCDVKVVNSSFKVEKNGDQQNVKPWAQANVVFLPSNKVGRLVYGTLAEKTNPVSGVAYQDSVDGMLISKFSDNEPLTEFTSAQALNLPVIDDGESIYLLEADKNALDFTPSGLEFTSSADTTGKKVTVTTDADEISSAAVAEGGTWATVTFSGKEVLVKVSANSGESATARETTVTVTDSLGQTGSFKVSQGA